MNYEQITTSGTDSVDTGALAPNSIDLVVD